MSPIRQLFRREEFEMNSPLTLWEVSPRDGFQSENKTLSLATKHQFISALVESGLRKIEVGSFVKSIPQLADTDELVRSLDDHPLRRECTFTGLIFNAKGLQRAVESGVDGVCVVAIPSHTLSQRNTGVGALEGLKVALDLVAQAKKLGLFVRVDIATSWVCPFEGAIPQQRIFEFAESFLSQDTADEVALCDTIGHAHPLQVHALFASLADKFGVERLAAHFHDTQGLALANVTAAYSAGVRIFDASLGGLGGCPFAPGAAGNLATEDFVLMAQKYSDAGVADISLSALWRVIDSIEKDVGRNLGGGSQRWWRSICK